MIQLVSDIQDFIKSEELIQPGEKILVAVSAGVDSMVLAHILDGLGYDLGLAHVNFQLRGQESDLDEEFIRQTATALNMPVYIKKVNIRKPKKRAISTQMAARDLRYQWFHELLEVHDYQKIATAHHLNDVLETVLLNLTKGTGIAGLHGILPKQKALVRPLIGTAKEQIVEYARNAGLKWREDQSNALDNYQRNLIRNQVVPVLKKINPSIEATTKNTVEIIRSVEKQYLNSIEQLQNELFVPDGVHLKILKNKLNGIEPAVFSDLVRNFGFNYHQCKCILYEALRYTGKIFRSGSHTLNIDRDEIIISPNTKHDLNVTIDKDRLGLIYVGKNQWHLAEYAAEKYSIKTDNWVGAFDRDLLVFPLRVRNWLPGDRFRPMGMKNFKKISDFLVDNKVPVNYKTQALVLLSNDKIIWLVGHRIDDRFKITKKTRRVLEIRCSVFPGGLVC